MTQNTQSGLQTQELIFNTSTTSDPGTSTSMQEALDGTDKESWKQSAKSEIENFLKRGSWEKVERKEAISKGRKIIPYKWVFKIKHKLNNTIRYKMRLCVKGFHQ